MKFNSAMSLIVALLFGVLWMTPFPPVLLAKDNSVEVTLEDTPEVQKTPSRKDKAIPRSTVAPKKSESGGIVRWRFEPKKNESNSKDYLRWRSKYDDGSDKPLGSTADMTAINALLPDLLPVRVRWVSRSIVVAVAGPSLYVVEKHRSKWKITHRYPILLPSIAGL